MCAAAVVLAGVLVGSCLPQLPLVCCGAPYLLSMLTLPAYCHLIHALSLLSSTTFCQPLRNLLMQANLDEAKKRELMAAIQAHFKDWLTSSGSMRQIYDLAKVGRWGTVL